MLLPAKKLYSSFLSLVADAESLKLFEILVEIENRFEDLNSFEDRLDSSSSFWLLSLIEELLAVLLDKLKMSDFRFKDFERSSETFGFFQGDCCTFDCFCGAAASADSISVSIFFYLKLKTDYFSKFFKLFKNYCKYFYWRNEKKCLLCFFFERLI